MSEVITKTIKEHAAAGDTVKCKVLVPFFYTLSGEAHGVGSETEIHKSDIEGLSIEVGKDGKSLQPFIEIPEGYSAKRNDAGKIIAVTEDPKGIEAHE
jgi:hypothetical protein